MMVDDFSAPSLGYCGPHTKPFLTSSLNVLYPMETCSLEMDNGWSCPAVGSTAATKQLIFKTEMDEDGAEWRHKESRHWTPSDVMHWIASVAESEGFPCECVNANAFSMDGKTLLTLTSEDFVARDEKYGLTLYNELYTHLMKNKKIETLSGPSMLNTPCSLVSLHQPPAERDPSGPSAHHPSNSDARKNSLDSAYCTTTDSDCSDTDEKQKGTKKKKKKSSACKRPPGRPPGVKTRKHKPEKKIGRLWEFIRDLLLDPQYCPSIIRWENHEHGEFRFVTSGGVAEIWAARKGNSKMNYEKLSRCMRHCYKSQILLPVLGRRLVYKFGPNAKGWRTENPNFEH